MPVDLKAMLVKRVLILIAVITVTVTGRVRRDDRSSLQIPNVAGGRRGAITSIFVVAPDGVDMIGLGGRGRGCRRRRAGSGE